jgi:hypothetical protein
VGKVDADEANQDRSGAWSTWERAISAHELTLAPILPILGLNLARDWQDLSDFSGLPRRGFRRIRNPLS